MINSEINNSSNDQVSTEGGQGSSSILQGLLESQLEIGNPDEENVTTNARINDSSNDQVSTEGGQGSSSILQGLLESQLEIEAPSLENDVLPALSSSGGVTLTITGSTTTMPTTTETEPQPTTTTTISTTSATSAESAEGTTATRTTTPQASQDVTVGLPDPPEREKEIAQEENDIESLRDDQSDNTDEDNNVVSALSTPNKKKSNYRVRPKKREPDVNARGKKITHLFIPERNPKSKDYQSSNFIFYIPPPMQIRMDDEPLITVDIAKQALDKKMPVKEVILQNLKADEMSKLRRKKGTARTSATDENDKQVSILIL